MKLSFHGADRGVTGSCHFVEAAGKRILIDCGFFQGGREEAEANGAPFDFDPRSVDFLLLTHAHLDHCGRVPLLVKRGFRGKIVATSATRELARIVLLDSGGLQEEEARGRARRLAKRGRRDESVRPLYTEQDALYSLDFFGERARYDRPLDLAPGLVATFIDAGHILGSACIHLEATERGSRKSVLFSGDLGSDGRPIVRDPSPPPRADAVVMESTYGGRLHKPLGPSVEELHDAVAAAFRRGGNVVIPTFALERAQEVLFHLREGVEGGGLPGHTRVFLDSPMAISATEIFRRHPECYDEETTALFREGRDPLRLPGLAFTRGTEESRAINGVREGAVIMAGSGMCTGGRVRHHLRHNLSRPESAVVFVGFAAKGTPARAIIDGAPSIRMFGEEVPVRASIHTIGGFSAHADQAELLAWHGQTGSPERTFLVHGEEEAMRALAAKLGDTRVEMPAPGEEYEI